MCVASAGQAQTLAASSGAFTLDGSPTFIVFASYFDGVRRIPDDLRSTSVLDGDLAELAAKGVGGIRVFPNWYHPAETLMDERGSLRPLQLEKLKRLIDRAAAKRIVVDVSFARETVKGLNVDGYRKGIEAAAAALKDRRAVLFDLQNEWSNHEITLSQLKEIRDAVKRVDPGRLVAASSGGEADEAVGLVKNGGFDVVAYHDPRDAGGAWARATGTVVEGLKRALGRAGLALPIYLQEPNRFGGRGYYDNEPSHYLEAVRGAKAAGAGAWTFHSDPQRDLNGSRPPFRDLLEPGERQVLDGLAGASRR